MQVRTEPAMKRTSWPAPAPSVMRPATPALGSLLLARFKVGKSTDSRGRDERGRQSRHQQRRQRDNRDDVVPAAEEVTQQPSQTPDDGAAYYPAYPGPQQPQQQPAVPWVDSVTGQVILLPTPEGGTPQPTQAYVIGSVPAPGTAFIQPPQQGYTAQAPGAPQQLVMGPYDMQPATAAVQPTTQKHPQQPTGQYPPPTYPLQQMQSTQQDQQHVSLADVYRPSGQPQYQPPYQTQPPDQQQSNKQQPPPTDTAQFFQHPASPQDQQQQGQQRPQAQGVEPQPQGDVRQQLEQYKRHQEEYQRLMQQEQQEQQMMQQQQQQYEQQRQQQHQYEQEQRQQRELQQQRAQQEEQQRQQREQQEAQARQQRQQEEQHRRQQDEQHRQQQEAALQAARKRKGEQELQDLQMQVAVCPGTPTEASRLLDRDSQNPHHLSRADVAPLMGVPGATAPPLTPAMSPAMTPHYPPISPVAGVGAPAAAGVMPGVGVGPRGVGLAGTASPYVTLHTNMGVTEAGNALGVKTPALATPGIHSLLIGVQVPHVVGHLAALVGVGLAVVGLAPLAASTPVLEHLFPSAMNQHGARLLTCMWGASLLPLAAATLTLMGAVTSDYVGTESVDRLASCVLVGCGVLLLVTLQAVSLQHMLFGGVLGGLFGSGLVLSAFLLTRTFTWSLARSLLDTVWSSLTPRSPASLGYTVAGLGLIGTGIFLYLSAVPDAPIALLGGPPSLPSLPILPNTTGAGAGSQVVAVLHALLQPWPREVGLALTTDPQVLSESLAVFVTRCVGGAMVTSGMVCGFLSGAADRLLLATSVSKVLSAAVAASHLLMAGLLAAAVLAHQAHLTPTLATLILGQLAVGAWAALATACPAGLQGASRLVVGGHHLQLQVSHREPPTQGMTTRQFWEAMTAPREEF